MRSGPIKSPQDFWGGMFIVALAAAALWLGRGLTVGTLGAIGPGMIPRSFAVILGALGLLLAASAFLAEGPSIGRLSLRGVILVPVAVLAFAYTVRPLGLVVATPLAILVSSSASSETRWGEAIVFAAVVTALCIGLFKYALRLPIPLAPFLLGY